MAKNAAHAHVESSAWTSAQAYGLAIFCLVFGLVLGYLFRGSAPAASASESASAVSSSPSMGNVPPGLQPAADQGSPQQSAEMVERVAEPLVAQLRRNPQDFSTLVKLGNLYYDAQQFPQATSYYEKAIRLQPDNSDVRTDLGTSYWYSGDADKAITEFNKALKYNPTHPGTLFNMGVVKWQGKMDPAGAVQAWEKLLQTNPNYPQKQQVMDLIARARQHAKG